MKLQQAYEITKEYVLKYNTETDEDQFNEMWNSCDGWAMEEILPLHSSLPDGEIEIIRPCHHIGGEGEGDHMQTVYEVNHPEFTKAWFAFSGYYDSWNGTDWNNKEMVEPIVRPVTFYERTKEQ